MKYKLFYTLIIFFLTSNAYSVESETRMLAQRENLKNGTAASLGIYGGDIFYAGFNLSYITSSNVIQYSDRKTIYPLYLVVGFNPPWKISPYIEAGVDLPEVVFDELFDDENNAIDQTDYFYSGGLKLSVTKQFSLSLYAKKYKFIFRQTPQSPISRASAKGYGVGMTLRF